MYDFSDEIYKRIGEATPERKQYSWETGIGLQSVDGLKTSQYLQDVAQDHITGKISFTAAKEKLHDYYKQRGGHVPPAQGDTKQADLVSLRIAELLMNDSFAFSLKELTRIHSFLFDGLLDHPSGSFRTFDIFKDEWVLKGDSVKYAPHANIPDQLLVDLGKERETAYSNLTEDQTVYHVSKFIANLWGIHPFEEGNTRTTAVFLIKYLQSLGYSSTNDVFRDNSWYFRNALVRANYTNIPKNIYATTEYLEAFLRNVMLGEHNELKNRYLHVDSPYEVEKAKETCEYAEITSIHAGRVLYLNRETDTLLLKTVYNTFVEYDASLLDTPVQVNNIVQLNRLDDRTKVIKMTRDQLFRSQPFPQNSTPRQRITTCHSSRRGKYLGR